MTSETKPPSETDRAGAPTDTFRAFSKISYFNDAMREGRRRGAPQPMQAASGLPEVLPDEITVLDDAVMVRIARFDARQPFGDVLDLSDLRRADGAPLAAGDMTARIDKARGARSLILKCETDCTRSTLRIVLVNVQLTRGDKASDIVQRICLFA